MMQKSISLAPGQQLSPGRDNANNKRVEKLSIKTDLIP